MMKKRNILSLCTLVVLFVFISDLQSQETNRVLIFIRDDSPDLEFMLKEEVGVIKETLEAADFKIDITTLTCKPLIAVSMKLKPDLKIMDVSVQDYDGFIIPCMG